MFVKQINCNAVKENITRSILELLPDWFGIPEAVEEYVADSGGKPFFCACDGEKPVGFLYLKETGRYTVELAVMGVLKEYHRLGIGRKLFEEAKDKAGEMGYSFIQVKTVQMGRYDIYDDTNRFYLSLGFKELEVFPTLWDERNPCQIYIMSIDRQGNRRLSEKTICLVDITPDNWRLEWNVAESQKTYVADSAVLLARAYAYREQGSRAFVIYYDKTPVGMGLYYDCPERNVMIHDNRRLAKRGFYCLSQIFIDQRYQGCGYGKAAIKLVLEDMKKEGKYDKVVLCYIEGNDAARKLYEQFGFVETGRDGNEIIMEMTFA